MERAGLLLVKVFDTPKEAECWRRSGKKKTKKKKATSKKQPQVIRNYVEPDPSKPELNKKTMCLEQKSMKKIKRYSYKKAQYNTEKRKNQRLQKLKPVTKRALGKLPRRKC